MKKSFMTRALATGLSLAMAFSLTAATNVTTAAAAAKPAMKASKMTVKEGKSRTFLATAKTLKTYKITKAKVKNASAKQYISVKKNAKGTGIVVTGKKGGDTARKIVITFQNKKTKKTTTLNTKVVVKVVEKEPEVVETTLSATQAGASKITITSNKDIETDTFTVKKGNTEVKIASKEFTSDGKSATLVLENKIVAADYTVAASNAAISANFTGELSKLAEINFTSDYAIIDGDFGTTKKAYTFYVAQNQWKEDITESTSLRATSSAKTVAAVKGKVTFEYDQNITAAQLNDPVTCVLYDSTSGVTAQKTLKLSNKAMVAEIEPYGENGIYNANGKTLAVADKYTESFYYMFRAKDQYGNYLDDVDMMNDGNGFFSSFSGGLTNLVLNNLTTKIVDGVTYFAYPLQLNRDLEAGTATLILVAGGSGKSVNANIVVSSGNTVDKITVTAPTTVAVGDVAQFEYIALDKDGKEVTSYAQLSKVTPNPKAADPSKYGFYWTKVNGKAVLYFNTVGTDKSVSEPTSSMGTLETGTFLTTTYNSSLCSFSVKQSRYPAEISGLSSSAPTAQAVGRTLELKESDFKVVDQYGDEFKMADHPDYAIKAELKSGTAFGPISYAKATGTGVTSPVCTTAINGNGTTNQHQSLQLAAAKTGSSVYEFKLYKIEGSDANAFTNTIDATTKDVTTYSAKKITLTVSESSKFVSYEVTGPDMLFVTNDQNLDGTPDTFETPATYQPSISVVATDNTGAKVKLGNSDFTISGGKFVAAVGAGNNKIKSSVNNAADWNKYFSAANTTIDGSYVVTMNDGTVVEKTVKVSNAAPSIASLSYGTKKYITPATLDAAGILKDISGKDNYGFDLKNTNGVLSFAGNTDPSTAVYSASVKITVTDFVYASSHVTNNGSSDPKFYNITKGDKFTVEVAGGDGKATIAVVPSDTAYDNTKGVSDIVDLANAGKLNTVSTAALKTAGVTDVIEAYETDYQTAFTGKCVTDVDTLAKIQEIVNNVNLDKRVDDITSNLSSATVASFSAIGVNLTAAQVATITGSSITLADLNAIKSLETDIKTAYSVLGGVKAEISTGAAVVTVSSINAVSCGAATTDTNHIIESGFSANADITSNSPVKLTLKSNGLANGQTATFDVIYTSDSYKYTVTVTITVKSTDLTGATVSIGSISMATV